MAEENHTIRLLTEMREEMRDEFVGVREEIRDVRDRTDANRKRIVESEVRMSTELLAVSGSLDEIKALIRQQAAIKLVVNNHERRLRKLEGE